MKKTIIILLMYAFLGAGVFAADVAPEFVTTQDARTFGVYQVGHTIDIYSSPDEKSPIKQRILWNKDGVTPKTLQHNDLFIVYIAKKDLALMAVTDETDDWVEVVYDHENGTTGWIKKDDPFKFDTWLNFYNMYGRKYGLKILKGAPESVYSLYGTPEDNAKAISTIKRPELINLNIIRGNWMLVTVVDADKTPKTGYVRWRSNDGVKYLFPDVQ